ncbi:hypothetical protein [Streptomyces olivaceus]|uniref:hypothetical protein n=1 Tax=Streptomyces olivaceus TaxID=47716 RepID=UPI0036EDF866
MFHTAWVVDVRVEKDGRYAEYSDTMSVTGDDGHEPTEDDLIGYAKDLIVNSHPDMKAGRTVRASARRIE